MKKLIPFIVLVLVLVSGCGKEKAEPLTDENGVCTPGEGCTLKKEAYVGYEVGDQIPNLTLIDVDGNETKLYDLITGNDRFILSLSADWCGDCQRQNGKLNEYYSELEDQGFGAAVIYVNYSSADGSKTTNEEQMISYIQEINPNYPAFYDQDNTIVEGMDNKINAVPYNFILDENGIIKGITSEVDMDNLFLDNNETSRM